MTSGDISKDLILKTASWLKERWGVDLPEDPSAYNEREELLIFLTPRLQYLLDHEFEHLVNTMYRLDIPEPEFHAALAARDSNAIAGQLAEVVLRREIQRMETRIRYSKMYSEEE